MLEINIDEFVWKTALQKLTLLEDCLIQDFHSGRIKIRKMKKIRFALDALWDQAELFHPGLNSEFSQTFKVALGRDFPGQQQL